MLGPTVSLLLSARSRVGVAPVLSEATDRAGVRSYPGQQHFIPSLVAELSERYSSMGRISVSPGSNPRLGTWIFMFIMTYLIQKLEKFKQLSAKAWDMIKTEA